MRQSASKLNPDWVKQTLGYFQEFLRVTKFPHPEREFDTLRGRKFNYPEWLIMFIAVLSVKAKVKRYLNIHKLALQYWDIMTVDLSKEIQQKPISERQLRDRLKKICHSPRKHAGFIFQIFPKEYLD